MVSTRLRRYGASKPVAGDLVAATTIDDKDTQTTKVSTTVKEGRSLRAVKCLTAEEAESGRYSLSDVLLPLVSDKTCCPRGLVSARHFLFLFSFESTIDALTFSLPLSLSLSLSLPLFLFLHISLSLLWFVPSSHHPFIDPFD